MIRSPRGLPRSAGKAESRQALLRVAVADRVPSEVLVLAPDAFECCECVVESVLSLSLVDLYAQSRDAPTGLIVIPASRPGFATAEMGDTPGGRLSDDPATPKR